MIKTSDVDDVGGSGCALNGTSRSKTKEGKRWKDFVLGVCSVQTSMDEALMGRLCRAPCPMDQRIAARSEAPVVKAAVQGRTSELSMPASQVTTWGTIARDVALLHNACHIIHAQENVVVTHIFGMCSVLHLLSTREPSLRTRSLDKSA